jgi:phosphoribosylaminoimidazole-succinocarboxamide synthase
LTGIKVPIEDGTKKVIEHESEDQLIQSFTDNIVSSDGKKNGKVKGKGPINNAIAIHVFEYLESYNIATHFVNKINDRDMQVKKTELYPIVVKVHNVVTPALKKRYAKDKSEEIKAPLIEFYHGKDRLFDPVNNNFTDQALELAEEDELRVMTREGYKINALVKPFFKRRNVDLADITLQFGKYRGRLMLSSEITPDSCRLLDSDSGDPLSSERFDKDMGNISESYRNLHNRILGEE